METQQWPLTAAATQTLLAIAASASPKGAGAPAPKEVVKLALKELLVRGAYRIQIEKRRFGKAKVTLYPQQAASLPWPLATFDGALRPHTPGEIGSVIKMARKYRKTLIKDVGELFLGELTQRDLVEQRTEKALGIFSTTRWRRTASGDAWAATAAQHVQRLQGLPSEAESDPNSAARAAAAAGALALMVPVALAVLARLRRRSRRHGGDLDMDFVYLSDGAAFDPFDSVGDLFDSALEGGIDGIDAGVDAIDSAMDSVADSIDSAVDSGVDAGGGSDGGGGDGGGGGGNGGGGGGS